MPGDDYLPGNEFAGFTLERKLGGGGFGSVWRARDRSGRVVALKILSGKFSSGDTGRIRSEVEVLAAAASAESPHVVQILGGGTDPSPYVVMEFIEGTNLEDEIEAHGSLSQRETLRLVRGVAEALAVLQRSGIIHRDVKPANVMIARDGTVKLTDFGIAKIAGYESVTATGQLPLSAAYAAPEVWAGEATYQSDLYALGAMTFQCLTGQRPFNGTFVQLFEAHRTTSPELGLLPGETVPALRQLLSACLAKAAEQRPADAAAVLALVTEAERQLAAAEPGTTAANAATHQPRALGPWLIESKHPTQAWAFRCVHETSGDRATVEVHFAGELAYGDQLRKAVSANPALVPLGAERLFGTNRLILRPEEVWPNRPPGRFMFWVARQELPDPRVARSVSAELLQQAADSAQRLQEAAASHGITVSLSAENVRILEDGSIHVRRAGTLSPPTTNLIDLAESTNFSPVAEPDRAPPGDEPSPDESVAAALPFVGVATTVEQQGHVATSILSSIIAGPELALQQTESALAGPVADLSAAPGASAVEPLPTGRKPRRYRAWLPAVIAASLVLAIGASVAVWLTAIANRTGDGIAASAASNSETAVQPSLGTSGATVSSDLSLAALGTPAVDTIGTPQASGSSPGGAASGGFQPTMQPSIAPATLPAVASGATPTPRGTALADRPPDTPTGLTVTAIGGRQLQITWQPQVVQVDGYKLYYNAWGYSTKYLIATVGSDSSSYRWDNADYHQFPNPNYPADSTCILITAFNSAGESRPGSGDCVAVRAPNLPTFAISAYSDSSTTLLIDITMANGDFLRQPIAVSIDDGGLFGSTSSCTLSLGRCQIQKQTIRSTACVDPRFTLRIPWITVADTSPTGGDSISVPSDFSQTLAAADQQGNSCP